MKSIEFQAEIDVQLAAVMHALPDGIVMIDEAGIIVFVNHRLQELSLYRAEELIGRRVEVLVPDDLSVAHEKQRVLFLEQPIPRPMGPILDVRLRRNDGSTVPVDVRLSSTVLGTNTYALASVRDITAQKARDEALRQSEERFRSFVEAAPVMMFSLLPDGVIQSVNGEFERRTGWRRDDLIGTHFAPLVHPDDLTDALSTLGRFMRGEVVADDEVRIVTTSGDYLLTQTCVVPLASDTQGVEMVGVIHDITEWVRTEEELRLTKERFRQAFKQAPLGVALLDQNGRITNANHAFCGFLGYPRDELLGMPYSSLIHPDDLAADAEQARKLAGGTVPSYRIRQRYVTKQGEVMYGTVAAASILDNERRPLYGMRTVENITQRMRFERELASHASIAKGKLATLTPRESEVLELLDQTMTAAEIGAQIFISTRTVESHLAHAYRKLGVRTRAEAIESFARMKDLVARFEFGLEAGSPDVVT